MKKFICAVLCTVALLASCDTTADTGGIPRGVYIAGENYNSGIQRACYWTGGKRVDLNGYYANFISVLGGQVLATGYFLTPSASTNESDAVINGTKYDYNDCYWIDSKRYNGWWKNKIIKSGKVYMLDNDGYSVDGQKIKIPEVAGYSLNPYAMTVGEDGTVYVAGYAGSNKYFFYADGALVELQEFKGSIEGIAVSNGMVYVWGMIGYINQYWVNGVKTPFYVNGRVMDMAVRNGVIYMAGYYGSGDKTQACWWADGERHDLNGSRATAIWVEE